MEFWREKIERKEIETERRGIARKENDEKRHAKYCKNASRKSCPVKSDRSGSLRRALPPEPSQFSGTVPQHNTGGQRTTLRN